MMSSRKGRWLIFLAVIIAIISLLYTPGISAKKILQSVSHKGLRHFTYEGIQAYYADTGKGPVLVLLHGTASSRQTWDGWVKQLSDSFRLIIPDLPAFGLTGPIPSEDYSIRGYCAFLDSLLIHCKIDSCYLAGNSLGGRIAWNYTALHEHQIKKLILIDPDGAPRDGNDKAWMFRVADWPVVGNISVYFTPKWVIKASLKQVFYYDSLVTNSRVDRYYTMLRRKGNRHALVQCLHANARMDTSLIGDITCPVLLMWGEDDRWIPLERSWFFLRHIPWAKLVTYQHSGHVPMEEHPHLTAVDARNFLLKGKF